jgi:hypothetical protein
VTPVVGSARGNPDLSMSAAVDGGVVVYIGYTNTAYGVSPGWWIVGGTSEATPVFSGLVAIADQATHRDLGWLNPTLYALRNGAESGIADITAGNNSVSGTQQLPPAAGQTFSVQGFTPYRVMTWPVGSERPTGPASSGRWPASGSKEAATEKAYRAGRQGRPDPSVCCFVAAGELSHGVPLPPSGEPEEKVSTGRNRPGQMPQPSWNQQSQSVRVGGEALFHIAVRDDWERARAVQLRTT